MVWGAREIVQQAEPSAFCRLLIWGPPPAVLSSHSWWGSGTILGAGVKLDKHLSRCPLSPTPAGHVGGPSLIPGTAWFSQAPLGGA